MSALQLILPSVDLLALQLLAFVAVLLYGGWLWASWLLQTAAQRRRQQILIALMCAVLVSSVVVVQAFEGPVCDLWEPWDPFWFFCCVLGLC